MNTNSEENIKKENLEKDEAVKNNGETLDNAGDDASQQSADSSDETNLEEDAKEHDDAIEKIAELQDKYLRQVAEFDNYRKRVIREKAELIKNGGEKVIATILPVIDDLERAKQNMDKTNDIDAIKEGLNLIIEKFMKLLKQEGLEKIDSIGQDFNVDFHEAVAMVPNQPDDMKGKVIDCIMDGYTLNDKVIRHAKVAVAQ